MDILGQGGTLFSKLCHYILITAVACEQEWVEMLLRSVTITACSQYGLLRLESNVTHVKELWKIAGFIL
jgi:hypothetical protein